MTYDDQGNVIPLSERFNPGDNDIRFSRREDKEEALASAVPGDKSPFKATDVTSATGAKILNNLETFAKEVENISFRAKGAFLTKLGGKLGAHRDGSSSLYATFKAKNGTEFTLRLANHNATVSNFDNRGEDNGISIVVSRAGNKGIVNDGDAYVDEYFYSDKALRKAENSPYAEIVKSVIQSLYSGAYKDKTGLAIHQSANTLFRYSPEEVEEAAIRFRKVEDPAKIEELENGPKVTKIYRSAQFIEDPNGDWEYDFGDGRGAVKGNLYAPMSGKVEGKGLNPIRPNEWEDAEPLGSGP